MKLFKTLLGILGVASLVSCTTPSQQEIKTDVRNNAVIETIMTRRSVRKYQPQAVNRDTMQIIVECGINAPNAINRQAWEIRVVDNPEVIKKLTDLYVKDNPKEAENPNFINMFRNAPTVAFIANDTTFAYSPVDCGLMAENMILSAWSMGIGSCCLGGPARFMKSNPEANKYLQEMGFSENYDLLLCIGFGYPAETPKAKPRDAAKVKFMD
jgi:nitroreductase